MGAERERLRSFASLERGPAARDSWYRRGANPSGRTCGPLATLWLRNTWFVADTSEP